MRRPLRKGWPFSFARVSLLKGVWRLYCAAMPFKSQASTSPALALSPPVLQSWAACPACGDPRRKTWVSFPEMDFSECEACRTVYKSREELARDPSLYEESYFHGRRSAREKRFEHRVRKAMGHIRSVATLGTVTSVLDVGCSLGYVVEAGRRLGLQSAGTDVSQYAVQVCRERGLRAEVGTLDKLPFADGEFDLVIMRHVIEHTPAPLTALVELKRILRPGGLVLIAVPDLEYWKGRWRRRTYRYFRPDDLGEQHYVYYRDASLRRMLSGNGFEVLAGSKAFLRPSAPIKKPWELLRFAALACWQVPASALHLRRELFFVARRT